MFVAHCFYDKMLRTGYRNDKSLPRFTSCFPLHLAYPGPARGLYLIPKSLFLIVFTFAHQLCPHNRRLQYSVSLIRHGPPTNTHMHCCPHTCDADTAGKEVGFGWSRLCPSHPPLTLLFMPSGDSGFTKLPHSKTTRTSWLS